MAFQWSRGRSVNTEELIAACEAALSGDWQRAHSIVQRDEHDVACWIHAVLHKTEGDEANSRYWYARTVHDYAEWTDPRAELLAIRDGLASHDD